MEKYIYLALTLSAAVGFGYGLYRFFRQRSAMYIKMIVFGIGCAMLGRLFETLQLFANGQIQTGFHVGVLGVVGSFLFFFTANYGQMDSLVDDKTTAFRKYRLIALAAPACIMLLYLFYFLKVGMGQAAVVRGIETLIISQAAYYHLKHLIMPDVDYGVIRSLRLYNLLALGYSFPMGRTKSSPSSPATRAAVLSMTAGSV
ncbi:MAG: hypothetical protein K5695_11605 [Oscillospiraceae bacterium]|nr:hypothetical protein [Oscillospiraceae bacterium]